MKENWKLSGGCVLFITTTGGDNVYVAPADDKKLIESVSKLVKKKFYLNFKEVWVENYDKFRIRLDKNLTTEIEINHPDISEDKWYVVQNWMLFHNDSEEILSELHEMMEYTKVSNLRFEGEFSAIFSPKFPREVRFLCNNDPSYDDYVMNLGRKLLLETSKKTTKWKQGHYYSTPSRSYYYLGDIKYRMVDKETPKEKLITSSLPVELMSTPTTIKLFLDKLPIDTDDLFKNTVIDFDFHDNKNLNYLDFTTKVVSSVDCGEFIDPLKIFSDPKKLRLDLIKNTVELCKFSEEIPSVGIKKIKYRNIHLLFEPLLYYFGANDEPDLKEIGKDISPIIEPIINSVLEDILEETYDNKKSKSEIVNDIEGVFFNYYILDSYFKKKEVISKLLKSIGINLRKNIEDLVDNFKIQDWKKDLETYLSHEEYFRPNYTKTIDLKVKSKSIGLSPLSENVNVAKNNFRNQVSSSLIRQEIVDTCNWCQSNEFYEILDYHRINKSIKAGYPDYVSNRISILNIISRYKMMEKEIPEDLVEELLKEEFWEVRIEYDHEDKLDIV